MSPQKFHSFSFYQSLKTRVLTINMENPDIPVGNQMVRIIPFWSTSEIMGSGQSDAFLLLLLGFTADVYTFCMLSIFC